MYKRDFRLRITKKINFLYIKKIRLVEKKFKDKEEARVFGIEKFKDKEIS